MKWRNGGGGDGCLMADSWLTATAVATDSCHCLPKRSLERHVADVKNIISDDQVTQSLDQNYANIAPTIEIYVYEIASDARRLTAASGDCSDWEMLM